MTSHKDSTDTQFQATIDGLTHTSISTKLSIIESLESDLSSETTGLEVQRAQLHKHKQKITDLVSDLKSIQSGEEYTVEGGGGSGGSGTLPPGKVIFVDSSYAGGSDDGSREKPFASLSAAITAKCAVDDAVERIFEISAGTYTVTKTIVKDTGVKQKLTFRGRGTSSTFIQGGATFSAGKASDCLRLEKFGSLRFEKVTFKNCKYGVRVISCDEIDVIDCKFTHCGASSAAANFDSTLTISQQVSQYAAEFTEGGAIRVQTSGKVRMLDNQVFECNRGLRAEDCVAGGLIKGNLVRSTGQAGIYLASSLYTGATGCQDFLVTSNQVVNAGNNSLLCIGGQNNTFTQNVCRDGWNTGCFLWHCCETTVSDNLFENTNAKTFNGQGVLADAHGAGVVADGDTAISGTATYQCRITGNVITAPGAGRVAAGDIYAIRIMNDAFTSGDKVYIQGNKSQGGDRHFINDGASPPTILDMDSRATRPFAPTVYENLSTGDNVQILSSDKVVLIKHDQVENLTVTMPADCQNGQVIVVKNYHIGDGSQAGNYNITLRPAQGQTPTAHKIDYKFDTLELKASSYASGLMSDENEAARLMWYAPDATFISMQDAY